MSAYEPISPSTMTDAERSLCEFFDRTAAQLRVSELRGLYEIGRRVLAHRMSLNSSARTSFARCTHRLGRDRTTLLRYAFVAQRIQPDEFESLLSLTDARGYPVAFWDLIAVAELGRSRRREEVMWHLATRTPASTSRLRIRAE